MFQMEDAGYLCSSCNKVCKSKSGLARHTSSKHKSNEVEDEGATASAGSSRNILSTVRLNIEQFCNIVNESAKGLSEDKCFPKEQRIFCVQIY